MVAGHLSRRGRRATLLVHRDIRSATRAQELFKRRFVVIPTDHLTNSRDLNQREHKKEEENARESREWSLANE